MLLELVVLFFFLRMPGQERVWLVLLLLSKVVLFQNMRKKGKNCSEMRSSYLSQYELPFTGVIRDLERPFNNYLFGGNLFFRGRMPFLMQL